MERGATERLRSSHARNCHFKDFCHQIYFVLQLCSFFLQPVMPFPYFLCFYLLSAFSLVDVIFLHKYFKDLNVFIIRPILSSIRTLLWPFFLEMSMFVYKKCSCKSGRVQFVLCSVSQSFLSCKLLIIHHSIQKPLTWASNDNGIVHAEMQIC